ncbi:MAG: sulfite exporter TauE/SafE family protein [Selenomonadaceae bacterium]|nr:sulfite exporter TauE/SafE family protein [Selenomonadaceae bacterium]
MEYLIFLLLGVGVGTFGTLVGIGGGLICVPVFIFFMSAGGIYPYFTSAPQITGTSLVIVLANALSGTLAYIKQKRVYFKAAVPFALATLPGAFLGSYIVDKFSGPMLNFYFGLFLLCMAFIMYHNSTHKHHSDIHELPAGFKFNSHLGIISSMGVGFLSSIFGIGGGVIHVPLMVYLLGFPVHVATATSHFVLAVSALCGVVSHFLLAHIVWIPAIAISVGAAIGAQIGAKISQKTRSKVILILLSCAMFALGLRLIFMGSAH